ncbi:MAG: cysteine desulfurase family protein [bacterium]
MEHRIYLDHSATTPVRKEVVDEIIPFLTEHGGNPSSRHKEGRIARTAFENAREKVAAAINAAPKEIVFNSCATEGNNSVLKGYMAGLRFNITKNHIITTAVEHPSVYNTAKLLAKNGIEVTFVPVDAKGNLDIEFLKNSIKENTGLISVMMVNNETGNIYPVGEIAKIAKEKNILMHVDAVQAVGKIAVDVKKIDCDFLTISAHKFYGLKGVGALYTKWGKWSAPMIVGGHQEKARRPGTENVVGVIGMGKAIELAVSELEIESKRIKALRDHLERRILTEIPYTKVVGNPENRVANISNISFRFIEGESIQLKLDNEGIAVSTGSACSSGTLEPSHVIAAMGVEPEEAHSSIRFSLGRSSNLQDIDYTVEKTKQIVEQLRSFSPIYDKFITEKEAGGVK